MINLNKILCVGNLTADPELRNTPQGTAVLNMRIAINSPYKDKNNETQSEVVFITVVAWSKLAEVCAKYLKKGRAVFVDGRVIQRSYENQEGKKITLTEIRANNVQFLDKKIEEEGEK